MNTNAATLLLIGSQNIDKMERDINNLTSMMRGMVKNHVSLTQHRGKTLNLSSGNGSWEIIIGWDETHFVCHIDSGVIYSSIYGTQYLHGHTSQIQDVYESLPTLVNGLVGLFPELEHYLKPFLRAAEKVL